MSENGYFAGVDVGTSYVKCVIIDKQKNIVSQFITCTGPNIEASINAAYDCARDKEPKHITATGFGRNRVKSANTTKTEISCHAKGAYHYFPQESTIIDIGGQDTKVIKIDQEGKKKSFKINRKCAAGTGAFLEEIANRLNIPPDEMNTFASRSDKEVSLGSYCTVFAKTEVLSLIEKGEKVEDIVKGAFESVVMRVIEMGRLEGTIVMTGGVVAHNDVIVKILEAHLKTDILTPPDPQSIGAMGAALFAMEEYSRP